MKIKANVMDYGEVEIELSDETVKEIGNVYRQLLEPTVKEVGQNLRIIPSLVNIIAHPIYKKRLANEHEIEMAKLVSDKLKEAFQAIPANKYIEPRISMRIAAENTFLKVFYDENLSDMFIKLFEKSAHQDYTDTASELFMGILDNMIP